MPEVVNRLNRRILTDDEVSAVYEEVANEQVEGLVEEYSTSLSTRSLKISPIRDNTIKEEEGKRLYIREFTCRKINNITIDLYDVAIFPIMPTTNAFNTECDTKLSHTDEGNFFVGNIKNRIKLGKILKAITELKDHEIEVVVSEWKKQYIVDTSIVEISEDVGEVYSYSSVGNSCMANKDEDWFDIYKDIGSKIAFISTGINLHARALLHTLKDIDNGTEVNVIDRIFFDTERDKLTLQRWAKDNGYTPVSDFDNTTLISSPTRDYYDNVPYVDNIYKVLKDETTNDYVLSNCTNVDGYKCIDTLQDTSGNSEEGVISVTSGVWCEDIEEYRDVGDSYYCESEECYYAYNDTLVYVYDYGYCSEDDERVALDEETQEYDFIDNLYYTVDGYYTSSEDYYMVTYGYNEGEYAHIDASYNTYEGERVLEDDALYIEDLNEYVLLDNKDEYYLHSDDKYYTYEEEIEDEEV